MTRVHSVPDLMNAGIPKPPELCHRAKYMYLDSEFEIKNDLGEGRAIIDPAEMKEVNLKLNMSELQNSPF